jgi:hypothetical protein
MAPRTQVPESTPRTTRQHFHVKFSCLPAHTREKLIARIPERKPQLPTFQSHLPRRGAYHATVATGQHGSKEPQPQHGHTENLRASVRNPRRVKIKYHVKFSFFFLEKKMR